MEIILKQDVQNLGFKDDVVTVKNGYGRNYLIPQGFAVLATPSAKKVLAETLKQRAYKEQHIIDEAKKTAKSLLSLAVKIVAKVGAGDKLFGVYQSTATWQVSFQRQVTRLIRSSSTSQGTLLSVQVSIMRQSVCTVKQWLIPIEVVAEAVVVEKPAVAVPEVKAEEVVAEATVNE